MVQKLLSDPDIESFLRSELACTVITVARDGSTESDGAGADAPLPDDGDD